MRGRPGDPLQDGLLIVNIHPRKTSPSPNWELVQQEARVPKCRSFVFEDAAGATSPQPALKTLPHQQVRERGAEGTHGAVSMTKQEGGLVVELSVARRGSGPTGPGPHAARSRKARESQRPAARCHEPGRTTGGRTGLAGDRADG